MWGVDVCAPEDDPLMGEVTRALYASELVDGETAVEVIHPAFSYPTTSSMYALPECYNMVACSQK